MTVAGTPEGAPTAATGDARAFDASNLDCGDAISPVEVLAWALVMLAAAALRLIGLAQAPLTQAEGGRALGSWSAAHGRVLDAWPGGIVDALTALLFRLFGDGDAQARVVPALAGLLLVASFWLLRVHLGRVAALAAAFMAAVSPVFVYDARSVDGQALGAALAICLAAAVLRLLADPRPRLVIVIAVLLSFGLGTDAALLGSALLIGLWLVLCGCWQRRADVREAWSVVERAGEWGLSALPLTLAGLLLAFSRFGTGFSRLRPAALASWALAFNPSRSGVPWHYLLDVLAGYAAPVVILGGVAVYLLLRDGSWRARPAYGLLLVWLSGGLALNLFMAGREPQTLLLTFVPLTLLAGLMVERALRLFDGWRRDPIDLLLAAGLVVAAIYVVITGSDLVTTHTASAWQFWAGVMLAGICLGGAVARWRQDGPLTAAPMLAVLALVAVLIDLHGSGSVRTAGDEFLIGQRTTREGEAFARLLVAHGGGVDTITAAGRPALVWYLRDTVGSGGHGGARLIDPGAQVPAGFTLSGEPATVSRSWSPASWSGTGMIRWWIYREAWGRPTDAVEKLVVEGR